MHALIDCLLHLHLSLLDPNVHLHLTIAFNHKSVSHSLRSEEFLLSFRQFHASDDWSVVQVPRLFLWFVLFRVVTLAFCGSSLVVNCVIVSRFLPCIASTGLSDDIKEAYFLDWGSVWFQCLRCVRIHGMMWLAVIDDLIWLWYVDAYVWILVVIPFRCLTWCGWLLVDVDLQVLLFYAHSLLVFRLRNLFS